MFSLLVKTATLAVLCTEISAAGIDSGSPTIEKKIIGGQKLKFNDKTKFDQHDIDEAVEKVDKADKALMWDAVWASWLGGLVAGFAIFFGFFVVYKLIMDCLVPAVKGLCVGIKNVIPKKAAPVSLHAEMDFAEFEMMAANIDTKTLKVTAEIDCRTVDPETKEKNDAAIMPSWKLYKFHPVAHPDAQITDISEIKRRLATPYVNSFPITAYFWVDQTTFNDAQNVALASPKSPEIENRDMAKPMLAAAGGEGASKEATYYASSFPQAGY